MRIALLTDIHANREAFEACLAHAAEHGAGQFAFLGDFVGYGADPEWVLDTLIEHVARGAIALLGNHDAAALGLDTRNLNARLEQTVDLVGVVILEGEQTAFWRNAYGGDGESAETHSFLPIILVEEGLIERRPGERIIDVTLADGRWPVDAHRGTADGVPRISVEQPQATGIDSAMSRAWNGRCMGINGAGR